MLTTNPHPEPTPYPGRDPLAVTLPPLPGLDLRSLYDTVRTHGDFFDARLIGTYVLFLLADIAGTRAQSRPIALATQATFYKKASELFDVPGVNLTDRLGELAHEINQAFIRSAHGARFAPTFVGCYDLSLHVLAYLNAGGQTTAFRDSDGTRPLGNVSIPLGLFSHRTYEPAVQAFEPGAKLLLVTRGVAESRPGRAYFDEAQALRTVREFTGTTALELCQSTLERAQKFRQPPWYMPLHLPFLKRDTIEDLTALALIRTA